MKKFILLIIIILSIIFIINKEKIKTEKPKTKIETNETQENTNQEKKGVFISYIDYADLKGKTKDEQEKIITEMINNISYFGLNSIILQVRPFSDAIYNSEIYQTSKTVVNKEGDKLNLDILEYFIQEAKQKDIEIYAWVNPYRIRSENNITDINENSYYYKWIGTNNIQRTTKGIYLNPSSEEVLKYITNGLKELCENYEIKGVIYDDYFYPNDTIDIENYNKSDKTKNLKEYRIENINKLLKESYKAVKETNKELKFGISPAGNIENNLDKEYLDIKNVLNEDYLDLIIPQLYYGFNNTAKPYIKTYNDWSKLNTKQKDLYIALSLYKSGKVDQYAGKGENEWLEESNIIKKQILISRNDKNYKGFYIFRYEYLFEMYKNENLNKEIKNLKELLDT